MHRRSVLKGLGLTTGLALTSNAFGFKHLSSDTPWTTALADAETAPAGIRLVETPTATLRISERTGDLVGLHWKDPELEVIQESRLGENFRLLVPKPGYEAAFWP